MRDDFNKEVKRVIAAPVNDLCSNPSCRAQTTGPKADFTKAINIGVAAHITAASPGGPRYAPALTPEERRHADNAIRFCQNCGNLVDNDEARFTGGKLRRWKQAAESDALSKIGKVSSAADQVQPDTSIWQLLSRR